MANAQNLKTLSSSEAREYGRQGGIKSGEVRRGNKRIKEVLDNLLHAPADQQWVGELHKIFGKDTFNDIEITNQTVIIAIQINKAITEGDTKAFNAILDRLEGKPTQAIDHKSTNNPVPIVLDLSGLKTEE